MSDTESNAYKKCINCGKHCPATLMINRLYCCEECASQYRRCENCGNYYSLDSEHAPGFCSSICHDSYTNIVKEVKT